MAKIESCQVGWFHDLSWVFRTYVSKSSLHRHCPFFVSHCHKSVRAHNFDPNLWWLTATSNLHTTFPIPSSIRQKYWRGWSQRSIVGSLKTVMLCVQDLLTPSQATLRASQAYQCSHQKANDHKSSAKLMLFFFMSAGIMLLCHLCWKQDSDLKLHTGIPHYRVFSQLSCGSSDLIFVEFVALVPSSKVAAICPQITPEKRCVRMWVIANYTSVHEFIVDPSCLPNSQMRGKGV